MSDTREGERKSETRERKRERMDKVLVWGEGNGKRSWRGFK